MPKPKFIRADTIDLQDRANPSAQDHSRSNLRNTASSPVGPHQAETLREVAHETADENLRSPPLALDRGAGDIDDSQPNPHSETRDPQTHPDDHENDDHHHGDDDSSDYVDSDDDDRGHQGPRSANDRGARDRPDGDMMRDQDALAVAQNGGVHDDSDMDIDGDDDLDDDMTGGISSSPSIEDEDIDFEYVYALHTFVATVEGQANATKGDTMVLLDDSNSYWWLVRIVKDSSIGYLPAEHIETPTERLARLNKHRNIDLSATMLQDTSASEKSKSSFTIRRRKKNVTFAAPTYVDYSDFDYSSDDEDQEEIFAQQQMAAQQAREQQAAAAESQGLDSDSDNSDMNDETAKVEPLKPRAAKEAKSAASSDPAAHEDASSKSEALKRASEDMFDGKADGVSRSRNGTVRNTDSFFKDDTVETKKITLTPNLLRDDNTPRASTESSSKELRQRPSLDKVSDRDLIMGTGAAAGAGAANGKEDKKKGAKDKKDKDKRPSVIRNFFSRKDKKSKGGAGGDDEDELGKRSMDSGEPRDSRDTDETEVDTTAGAAADPGGRLQRTPSKLQKQQPRVEPSPKHQQQQQKPVELMYVPETRNDISNMPPATMRIVDSETQEAREVSSAQPLRDDTARAPSRGEEYAANRQAGGPQKPTLVTSQAAAAAAAQAQAAAATRLSESPIEVSPVSPLAPGQPPPLMVDSSSQEGHSASPSPELLDAEDGAGEDPARGGADATPVAAEPPAAWNDAKLRAFFDSGTDIRDMLVVVLDKSDVAPAGPDHPVVGGLFREQNAKLAEITTQLDNMLGDWLARKQRLRGAI